MFLSRLLKHEVESHKTFNKGDSYCEYTIVLKKSSNQTTFIYKGTKLGFYLISIQC